MDPASATALFLLFLATEKAVKYAGGKVADSMTKPIWEALEEKAKWLAGKDDTAKRWQGFVEAFEETRKQLEAKGRHLELAKQIAGILNQFDLKTLPDNQWLDELAIQLEKASLVSEKPDEFLLVELLLRILPKGISRAELSETVSDFVAFFQDALFAQPAYKEDVFKNKQWQKMREPRYDTRERYLAQIIQYHENLDFVGIPELKDRQSLRIEDVFISLQTQAEELEKFDIEPGENLADTLNRQLKEGIERASPRELKQKTVRKIAVNQAMKESTKIVIVGDPGSGKTTLLKYMVLAYAENQTDKLGLSETRLPVFIRLYDYVAKRAECGADGFSFTDYLQKHCTDNLQLHLPPDFFTEALENGECCVCLDGLDELGAAGLRREVTQAVSAMANRYRNNRFIVTSRIVGYDEAPLDKNEFTHHTIQPLNDEDIKLFVEKWYKARERDVAIRRERTEHLVKTIMSETRIKSLAANPLMLTIIALVHRIEAELPHERVKLYDKCVTTLVETWDKVRGMKTTLRRRLLEKIAYWMHSQPGEKGRTREVREGTLRTQVIHFLQSDPKNNMDEDQIQKEAENFINLVKTRSGLLIERGEDIYTFSHLTFQEYLTARDIEKRCLTADEIWNEIEPNLHDAHWREVILLLLGSLNSHDYHNSILLRKIYERSDQYEPILHRHLLFATQALSDQVEVDSKLHDQIIDSLFGLLDSKDFWIAGMGFDALGSIQNDSRAANGLLTIARDLKADAEVRIAAAQALARLGRVDEAGKILLAIAGNTKVDAGVRITAAQALARLRFSDETGKILLTIAGDANIDTELRSAAAQALGRLGRVDETVLNGLLMIAGDANVDAGLRSAAAQALSQLGRADEAGKILLALAGDDKVDASVRSITAQILGRLGRADEAGKTLLAIAQDENVSTSVRRPSVQALGRLGRADETEKNLLALAGNTNIDPGVRSAAAQALGQLGSVDEAVMKGLLALAGNANMSAYVRRVAAQALGQLGWADEAGTILLALAGDENVSASVRRAAAQALGRLGRADEAGTILLVIAGDEKVDVGVRTAAAQALSQLGRVDEAGKILLALAQDAKVSVYVRSNAVEALARLGRADEAGKILLALAGDENVDVSVRRDAAETLGQLGRVDEAGIILLALAGDEKLEWDVRYFAYDALMRFLG